MKLNKPITYVSRFGKSIEADEVFFAWCSGDIDRMVRAISLKTNHIDRHYLLQSIVDQTYKRRDKSEMRTICIKIGKLHLSEFKKLAVALIEHEKAEIGLGKLPNIPTFKHLATAFTEDGEYDQAIKICKMAIKYNLHDGTKSGFRGRIKRIEKIKASKQR